MKCIVLKEYAGIKEGTTVNIHPDYIAYMTKKGYVKVIEPEIQTKVVEGYETKVIEVKKNKGGRPKKQQ